MRIVVSDSSCIIDLKKGGLLRAIFELPYSFVMPQPLFDDELLSLTKADKAALREMGLEVQSLSGKQVAKAQTYFNEQRRLKLNDCFAFVLAEEIDDAILFTGDNPLRKLAEQKQIEAHGMLWAIDELELQEGVPDWLLYEALLKFTNDPLVFLPEDELTRRVKRFKKKL